MMRGSIPAAKDPSGDYSALFDAIPCPALIVDADVRIIDYNRAAAGMLGENKASRFHRPGGEVLHCVHAEDAPGGCGHSDFCPDCNLRKTVQATARDGKVHRSRAGMEIRTFGQIGNLCLMVTASAVRGGEEQRILVLFEDVAELTLLEKILPICSYCRKIRNDRNYWENVEAYFFDHAGVLFSHSVCEDCMKERHGGIMK